MPRPKIDIKNKKAFRKVMRLYHRGLISLSDASAMLGISRGTFYNRMKEIEELKEEILQEEILEKEAINNENKKD